MFRYCAILFFSITIVVLLAHFLTFGLRKIRRPGLFSPIAMFKRYLGFYKDLAVFKELVLLGGAVFFVLLFVTGFFMPLVMGEKTQGYLLMGHLIVAPVFIILIVVSVFLFANAHLPEQKGQEWGFAKGLSKLLFWVLFVLAMPLFISILLSMLKLFGSEGQEFLLGVHRYCAIFFTVVFVSLMYVSLFPYFSKSRS